jgi:hypothetical protein
MQHIDTVLLLVKVARWNMRLRKRSVFLFFFFLSSTSWSVQESTLLKGNSCRAEITRVLGGWEKRRNWFLDLGIIDLAKTYLTPTQEIGVWLELRIGARGKAEVIRQTPNKKERFTWGELPNCQAKYKVSEFRFDSERMRKSFSDDHLRLIVQKAKRGIVYAWSPSMPLSFQGAKDIVKVGEKLGLQVFFALDPHAEEETARRSLISIPGADLEALRRIESYELFYRGVGVHYPAIIVFENGKIKGQSIPGVKRPDVYEELVKRELARK